MLGLALPAGHPVWAATEEPLPVEREDDVWVAEAPGWLVSGTRADGVVRVVNHGTDHDVVGTASGDSPLYARLGYSTSTAPLMSAEAWASPVDQSVVLLDARGRATHRSGMRTIRAETQGEGAERVAVGASVARARWVDVRRGQRDHGSGRSGFVQEAAGVTTVSVVRGAWEIRCVRVDALPGNPDAVTAAVQLRVSGWPLGDGEEQISAVKEEAGRGLPPVAARVRSRRLLSVIVAGEGFEQVGIHAEDDASPLGQHSRTPWAAGQVWTGRWGAVGIGLVGVAGDDDALMPGTVPTFELDPRAARVRVGWPDGVRTETDLPRAALDHLPPTSST
jgi:hypothetical protein